MNNETIKQIVENQKEFFKTGQTKNIEFRLKQLNNLKKSIQTNESEILNAIKKDLARCDIDSYTCDLMPLYKSINTSIKNLKKWTKAKRVKSMVGTKGYIIQEPLGNVLIISPWNYPILLCLDPLVAAIAAGNCAILKPSELSENASKIISVIIKETFPANYITTIEGAVEETKDLLNEKFDHIFFTGSTNVGKVIYSAAAKNLTPVTLELGGKSPVIVDKKTNIKTTAKRLIWGKLINNGQTCVAPDYVFVDEEIKNDFVSELIKTIKNFYGEDAKNSECYSRIINEKHFERLKSYLDNQNIIYGGKTDKSSLYIEPTLIESPEEQTSVMQNEIFGPILPIFGYKDIQNVIDFINNRPKPLAMYIFSTDKIFCKNIISQTSSGGMAINDTIMHLTQETLPFGGVGNSGIGRYHGKVGFDTFSNERSILKNTFLFDRDFLYPPYKISFEQMKKIVKYF